MDGFEILLFLLVITVILLLTYYLQHLKYQRYVKIFLLIKNKYPDRMEELGLSHDSIPEEFYYYAEDGFSFTKGIGAVNDYLKRNKLSNLAKPKVASQNIKKQYEMKNLIRFEKYKKLNDEEINQLAVLPRTVILLAPLHFILVLTPLVLVYLFLR